MLLTELLGDPERAPLTTAQFRKLAQRAQLLTVDDWDRNLTEQDLMALGYDREWAQRILTLLSDDTMLQWYVKMAADRHCVPVTRATPGYPERLRSRMGWDAPGCLWAMGDTSLLAKPAIALVGSRQLHKPNEAFAWEVGKQAALQGFVLVSGNAPGADSVAQNSAVAHGGQVISVLADGLYTHSPRENVLFLSEGGFDMSFTAQRALSRNRVIHALGQATFVAQTGCGKGGTWSGSLKNLKNGYSPLYLMNDGSDGARALMELGAKAVEMDQLQNLANLINAI